MAVYPRGRTYWFSLWWNGERIQRTTKVRVGGKKAQKAAEDVAAAFRTTLAKGELGIPERKLAPMLKDFSQRFVDYVRTRSAEKPKTVEFYAQQMARLLEFEPLATARLDAIDESLIEKFVQWRSQQASRAGTNRSFPEEEGASKTPEDDQPDNRQPLSGDTSQTGTPSPRAAFD